MNQYHIDRRPCSNREEHLTIFQMQRRRHKDSCNLRQAVISAEECCVLETVGDEHAKDGSRENIAKIADHRRCWFFLREQEKGEGAREYTRKRAEPDGDTLLSERHAASLPSIKGRSARHPTRMMNMVGSIKASRPKTASAMPVAASPRIPV